MSKLNMIWKSLLKTLYLHCTQNLQCIFYFQNEMTFTADMFLAMSWRDHRYNIAGRGDKKLLQQNNNSIQDSLNNKGQYFAIKICSTQVICTYMNVHCNVHKGSTNTIQKMCQCTFYINKEITLYHTTVKNLNGLQIYK